MGPVTEKSHQKSSWLHRSLIARTPLKKWRRSVKEWSTGCVCTDVVIYPGTTHVNDHQQNCPIHPYQRNTSHFAPTRRACMEKPHCNFEWNWNCQQTNHLVRYQHKGGTVLSGMKFPKNITNPSLTNCEVWIPVQDQNQQMSVCGESIPLTTPHSLVS